MVLFKMFFQHQQKLINQNPPKHLLAWGTGTGKTLTAIELAKKNCKTILIICPKALKTNWKRNIEGIPGYWIIISKEEFRRDWDKIEPCSGIIVDEAHFFANYKSQMSKALIKYIRKNKVFYRWFLTATPYLSSPWNIFTLANLLGENLNYIKFKYEFFNEIRFGPRIVSIPKNDAGQKLVPIIKKIGNTVSLEECADVPAQIFETEYFELTPQQKKEIKLIEEINPIIKYTKEHQIAGGIVPGNEYIAPKYISSLKLERVFDLINDNKKIIIVARYLNEIKLIQSKTTKECFIITGEIKDKQAILDTLKDRDEYVLLVSAGCSEGWELSNCDVMVFYSLDFSHKNHIQLQGRILRINNLKKNTYIYLVVEGIDTDVYKTIMKKKDFQASLYERT